MAGSPDRLSPELRCPRAGACELDEDGVWTGRMKTHLLVADDEEAIRRLLTTYFRREGWEIDAVGTAEETLRIAQDGAIGLVVLDIELGSEDGLTVLDQLKRARPGLPVVMLTGLGFDEELLLEAKRAGADGYVSKTLSLEQLKLEIQRVLRQHGV